MIIIAKDYRDGHWIQLEIEKGCIANVVNVDPKISMDTELFIAPGLIDLQVNGYNGTDFNDSDVTTSKIKNAITAVYETGVTSFFPTIITNSADQIAFLLAKIVTACNNDELIAATIAGIHLEGPFISLEDGPRGAHDKKYIRAPNWELFCKWQKAAAGNIKLITLSPEWEGVEYFIKNCVASGVKVAIGHTAASTNQIKAAILAGATLSTHLGNAAHLQLPRHPNYIWDQLAAEELWLSMIADGFHLPDSVLNVFFKTKPQKTFLISDATSFAGRPPGVYNAHIGGKVVLDDQGRLSMHETPELLAGSAQSLKNCITHLVKNNFLPFKEAWELASLKPLEFIKSRRVKAFQLNSPADLVLFTYNHSEVNIFQVIKSGVVVFNKTKDNA